ncbi:MAG: dihydrofolate reductase family protein [Ignavibacterium sp.]|nr:dihydrofolate reductase family protein [Ignavibacterium sp.]
MNRPFIILHMISSVNGKILTEPWQQTKAWENIKDTFDEMYKSFETDGWICGRVTMEKDFSDEQPQLITPDFEISRDHYVGDKTAQSFAVAIDPSGKLGWTKNDIGGDHIIEILSNKVSNEYLYYLQRRMISYIISGKDSVDLVTAFERLSKLFPIKSLLLQGGGYLNGSMLNLGLVDELNIVMLPIADLNEGPTSFELGNYQQLNMVNDLELVSVDAKNNGEVHLRYKTLNNQIIR